MKFSQLAQQLKATQTSLSSHPDRDPEISGVADLREAPPNTVSYVEGPKFAKYVAETGAIALILPESAALQQTATDRGLAWLSVPYPRLAFAEAIAHFYQPFRPEPGIHPTAMVHPSVRLGKEVSIGAYAVIQPDVVLGDQVCVHPHGVVYPAAQIGDRTVLHAHCVIHERAVIGADCVIHSGAVIGSEGFGFVPTREGWVKMEQSGITVLEAGVEVGCNTTIDRPAVGETRIKAHTKIDNLVQIGHGCEVGQGCAFASQVGLAGGVTVGDRTILAGQVGIANQVTIGSGTTATARAGIIQDVAAGQVVSGHPTVPHRQWLRQSALQQRLPEMYQTLKLLQQEVEALQKQLEP